MTQHAIYNFLTFGLYSFRDADSLREAYEKNKAHKRLYWITKDGTRIRVGDLTDAHVLNIARFMIRFAKNFQQNIPFPNFQGEMAEMHAEHAYDTWTGMDPEEAATRLFGNKAVAVFLECEDRGIEWGEK